MMWIYLLFPAVALILDYYAFKMQGTLISFILAVAAIGIITMGLPFIPMHNTISIPKQIVTTSAGNITIQPHNLTYTQPNSVISLALFFGEAAVFIQFGYIMLCLLWAFTIYKRRKYE